MDFYKKKKLSLLSLLSLKQTQERKRKLSAVFKDNRDNIDNFLSAGFVFPLSFVSAMVAIFKCWCFGLQTCFVKDAKMLKRERFYPGFA